MAGDGGLAPPEAAVEDGTEAAPPEPAADNKKGSAANDTDDSAEGGKAAAGKAAGLISDASALKRGASGPSPHYDPSREIVLRYEFLDSRSIKVRRWVGWGEGFRCGRRAPRGPAL